jgi:uncharacterized protein (TIGR02246 family)
MESEAVITELYRRMVEGWNARDADAMAGPLAPDGLVIGFDGSQTRGRVEAAAELDPDLRRP